MTTTTQTTLDADRRWRERLAATFAAWRLLDDWIDDVLTDEGELTGRASRELVRHRQRMADELDLLQREWVLRAARGGLR